MTKSIRTVSVVIASVVLIVGTYLAYEKYTRRNHAIALVTDTSARLRAALQAQAADNAGSNLEAQATAAEAHASTLRKMNTSSFRPLADAADDYLVTAREILRRQADMQRTRERVDAGFAALSAYIKADRGANNWTHEAARMKQALDKDARDYRIAVESYASLLQSLSASQVRMAPFVGEGVLIDDRLVADARQRALDAHAATDQNIRQVTSLDAYRRRR
jgi:hypothetical protein